MLTLPPLLVAIVMIGCSSSSSNNVVDSGTDVRVDEGIDAACTLSCAGRTVIDGGGGAGGSDTSFSESSCGCGTLKPGAAEGAPCTHASDCAATCCPCSTCGARSFQAAMCINGKCAAAADACSEGLVEQMPGDLCDP